MAVELTEAEMGTYRAKVVEMLQDKVKIAGFRSGKIPADVLEKHVGEQAFLNHILDLAITESYENAVMEKKLRPVAYPKIDIKNQNPLKYEAIIPVVPAVEWKKDISKLKVKRKKVKVEQKEIDEVLGNLKKRTIVWKDSKGAAKMGNRVELDFAGFDMDDKPLDGTDSKNHPVILGEGSLIPGFEDEVVGMKKDEEKDFEITFPKDYQADEFKGKKVRFHVKVNGIEESEERKMDDEFAKEITGGNRQTMKELLAEIEEELSKQKERQEEARLESEFLKEMEAYVKADVPEALVEREIDMMVERIKSDLEKRKQTLEEYEATLEKEGKKLRDELKDNAKSQVIIRLGLEKLYEDENAEVTEKEVEAELMVMMGMYPPHFAEAVKMRYAEGTQERMVLNNQLKLRKIVAGHTE